MECCFFSFFTKYIMGNGGDSSNFCVLYCVAGNYDRSMGKLGSHDIERVSRVTYGMLTSTWCCLKLEKRILESVIKFHDCSLVTTMPAIVWSTQNCYYILIMAPVISVHNQLVSSGYKCESIGMIKSLGNILVKGPAPKGGIPQLPQSPASDHSKSHIGPSWGTSCR